MILFSWVKQRSNLLAVNLLKILCSFSLQNYIISSFLNLFNIVSDSIFSRLQTKKNITTDCINIFYNDLCLRNNLCKKHFCL